MHGVLRYQHITVVLPPWYVHRNCWVRTQHTIRKVKVLHRLLHRIRGLVGVLHPARVPTIADALCQLSEAPTQLRCTRGRTCCRRCETKYGCMLTPLAIPCHCANERSIRRIEVTISSDKVKVIVIIAIVSAAVLLLHFCICSILGWKEEGRCHKTVPGVNALCRFPRERRPIGTGLSKSRRSASVVLPALQNKAL